MRRLTSILLIFSALYGSCSHDLEPVSCSDPTTTIDLEVKDFYSKQPVANLDFTLFKDPNLCFHWCWGDSIGHIKTDDSGKGHLEFRHDTANHFDHYLFAFKQKGYFQTGGLNLRDGCFNELDIKVKPANQFVLEVENSARGLGRTSITAFREAGFNHTMGSRVQDWGTYLASAEFDTIPPHTFKSIRFAAVPEENIKFQVWSKGNFTKTEVVYNKKKALSFHRLKLAF